MRRLPPAVWILAPLALGLLYAAGHALLAPQPDVASLPPADAILVERFRNLEAFDRGSFGPRGLQVRPARDQLGDARNVSGLPGVDHTAPLHMILMPKGLRPDSSMVVFQLSDAEAFEGAFNRTDFIAQGRTRHAQHLELRGRWGAIGPDREAIRQIGGGGITARALGEDIALAADVPRLVDHALLLATQAPWRGIVEALGANVEAALVKADPRTGAPMLVVPGDGRLGRIRDTWKTARLWSWLGEGRLQVELAPQPGPLADTLSALLGHRAATPEEGPPAAPDDAVAWARADGGAERILLAKVLLACGVRFVSGKAGDDALAGLGTGSAEPSAGVLIWAVRAPDTASALSIGLAARHGALPDLSAMLTLPASGTPSAPLAEGAAPLTIGDSAHQGPSPAGHVEVRLQKDGYDLLTLGANARQAIEEMRAWQARRDRPARTGPQVADDGQRTIATFFLAQRRAARILGRALQPGGVLMGLAGADLQGRLSTDGHVVRLVVERD